jgi:hypothetical protein
MPRLPEWWNPNARQRALLASSGIWNTKDLITAANKITHTNNDEIVCINLHTLFEYINKRFEGGFTLHTKTAFKEPNVLVEGKFPSTTVSYIPPGHSKHPLTTSPRRKQGRQRKNFQERGVGEDRHNPSIIEDRDIKDCEHRASNTLDDEAANCSFDSYGWDLQMDLYPPECYCPITHDVFRDPVVAADGYTYERTFITTWLGASELSPMTGENMKCAYLFANITMRQTIQRLTGTPSTTN